MPTACSEKTLGVRRSGSPCEGGLTLCGQERYKGIVASLQFRLKISVRSAIVDMKLRPKAIFRCGDSPLARSLGLRLLIKARRRVNVKMRGIRVISNRKIDWAKKKYLTTEKGAWYLVGTYL